jgi:chromosome segregation ATPase
MNSRRNQVVATIPEAVHMLREDVISSALRLDEYAEWIDEKEEDLKDVEKSLGIEKLELEHAVGLIESTNQALEHAKTEINEKKSKLD